MQNNYFKRPEFNPTEAQKSANDFAMAKEMINNYADIPLDAETIKRNNENINLHAGRWPELDDLSTGKEITIHEPGQNGEPGKTETFTIGETKIRHYDKIGRITRGMHGQFIAAPYVFIIKDISSKSKSMRDKLRLEGVKNAMYEKYMVPKINIITKQELLKNGINNMFELDPDQQIEMQNQINARVKKESPEEIMAILEKVKTPDEQVCQLLYNYTAANEKVKMKFDSGVEFAIITGSEYYRPYISNGLPILQTLIPNGVAFEASPHITNVEDGTWATYTQYLSVEDVISRIGVSFLKGDASNIDKYYNVNAYEGNTGTSYHNTVDNRLVEIIGSDPELRKTNFLSRDGQNLLRAMYARVGSKISYYKIQHKYVTWRWTTRMKVVTRLYNNKPKEFIVAGHYTFNPKTDLKIRTIIVPQVWQGERYGGDWFKGIGAIDYQYDSIQNPWNPKLGIYGGMYNTVMGTSKNHSLIDNGKIWNFKINQSYARIDEIRATDHGKIALMTLNAKPKGMKWDDWLNGILSTKFGIVSQNTEWGLTNEDKKIIQSIDMGRFADAANEIQFLRHSEEELQKSMFYSDAKSGDIGQYSTNQNAALQVEASDRQLLPFITRHKEIINNVSNAMLRLSLLAYRENEEVKSAVLDDFLKAHYELNMKDEGISQYALTTIDTMNELASVKKMTDLALAFVQNGVISLRELSRLFSAQTMAEAQDIIDEAETNREKKEQMNFEQQKEQEMQNAKIQQDLLKMKQDYDAMQKNLDRMLKIDLAEINSMLMANANDIDKTGVSDSLTKTREELLAKQKMLQEELQSLERIKDKELANNLKIANIKKG